MNKSFNSFNKELKQRPNEDSSIIKGQYDSEQYKLFLLKNRNRSKTYMLYKKAS